MLLDVLIPTNGQLSRLQPLMESISSQTLQPDRVVILVHKMMKKEEQDMLLYFLQKFSSPELGAKIVLITNLSSTYEPGKWRGHDRNQLIKHAKAKFVYMIDHDNQFGVQLFEQTADRWMRIKEQTGKESVISPTIMRRDTQKVQSQGITGFSFLVPKYRFGKMSGEPWQEVKMLGANSLFGLTETFQENLFDERFGRCMEDIDRTYRVSQSGTPVIVLNKVEIQHMESSKSKLDHLFLGNPASAYERSLNRILFVKKNANMSQKLAYFACGLRIQTVRFLLHIMMWGGKQRRQLAKAVFLGTKKGLS